MDRGYGVNLIQHYLTYYIKCIYFKSIQVLKIQYSQSTYVKINGNYYIMTYILRMNNIQLLNKP